MINGGALELKRDVHKSLLTKWLKLVLMLKRDNDHYLPEVIKLEGV